MIAVGIWGTFTAVAASALEAGVSYITLSLLVQALIYIPFAIYSWQKKLRYIAILKRVKRYWIIILISGVCSILRDVFFIYALSLGPKLQITVIDALWPIFVIVVSALLIPADRGRVSVTSVFLVFSAFVGASFLWLPTLQPSNIGKEIEFAGWVVYLAAALGAFSASLEVVTVRFIHRKTRLRPTLQNALFITQTPRAITALIAVSVLAFSQHDISDAFSAVPQVAFLTIGWAVASILFSYAVIAYDSPTVTSIAYLSPVLSALLLGAFFPDVILTPVVMAGVLLIVLSNILLHIRSHSIEPLIAATMIASWVAILVAFRPVSTFL
jgi:drug/metabolite transporter (DMT)-like permease